MSKRPHPDRDSVSWRFRQTTWITWGVVAAGFGFMTYVFSGVVDLTNAAVTGLVGPALTGAIVVMTLALRNHYKADRPEEPDDEEDSKT